uniref:cGMP-dependent protein kinase n=1 Tax=Calcidiscus leptoporus TaxID=127549 RepID=A0A7S0J4A9_9EUKA
MTERRMTATNRRREAVRGEATDDVEDMAYKPVVVEKTEEQKERLLEFISTNDLLKDVGAAQVQILVDTFVYQQCKVGDTIIEEGKEGNHFYMVDSGKFEVFISAKGPTPLDFVYEAGSTFGELALLYNSKRAATVKCKEDGGVWHLERRDFRHVVVKAESLQLNTATNFLKAVPVLSTLTDEQRAVLATSLQELNYAEGEYLLQQGQDADAMFFIKKGEVICHVVEDGAKKELLRLHEAEFFGESCLETGSDAKRKANVVAVGKVTVLKLEATTFKSLLGDLSDVVSKNLKLKVMEGFELSGTRIWPQLSIEEREKLLDSLTEKAYDAKAKIIEQGQPNNTFYIVKSGEIKVMNMPESGIFRTPRELATLHTGQFFGERALLTDEPANSTILAETAVVLYALDREAFTAIFGPLQTLIDAEIQRRDLQAQKPGAPAWEDLELRRILGVGTFGRVKLVVHKPTVQTYALKCMRKAQVVQMKQQQHVMHEKKILAMMDHPFILQLVATYQDKGELYMLLEVALGGELFTLLASKSPLPDQHARFYSSQVVSIFSYMHGLKVVYRDLKPENLLIDKEGYLKMVDFGFAKIITDRTWTLCGTPEYLAPEIILNKGHGFGADWWCVGILTFECLTGATPFVSNDPMEGYRKIIKCKVPWPHAIQPATRSFIDALLCVDPTRRLGALKNGSLDVRNHEWFKGLDWKKLDAKKLSAPHVPKIKSATDDSNFDRYEDEGIRNFPKDDFPRELFKDFAEVWV